MHFDDRLATVLRSAPSGEAMARVQYRQLLDLLGTLPVEAEGPRSMQPATGSTSSPRRFPPPRARDVA